MRSRRLSGPLSIATKILKRHSGSRFQPSLSCLSCENANADADGGARGAASRAVEHGPPSSRKFPYAAPLVGRLTTPPSALRSPAATSPCLRGANCSLAVSLRRGPFSGQRAASPRRRPFTRMPSRAGAAATSAPISPNTSFLEMPTYQNTPMVPRCCTNSRIVASMVAR